MDGGGLFYSRALCGGNTDLCKEREMTAQRGGRASVLVRAARHNSDITVAAALRGGDVEGVCSYTVGEEVSWTRGVNRCGHAAHMGVPPHGAYAAQARELEARRPHAVSARKEDVEALRETLLSSSWCHHLDHEATTQQSSEKATVQRR
jgi:hypothetical protein